MEFIKLSKKNVEEESKKLYQKIIKDYNYDLVIFIAKGSFYIGQNLAKLNNVPLLEIYASRKKNKIKELVKPILKYIPSNLSKKLRQLELKNNTKSISYEERYVNFDENLYQKFKNKKRILIVDDSIDTGDSVKQVKETLENYFRKSTIKVAVLNYMTKSTDFIKADYSLYKDTMLSGPWSNDSKEYHKMLQDYNDWKNK